MKNLIEIVLEEKTKELPTSILCNQWEFDKFLIPNALQAISAIFPHYSLHNESHSETIISNFIKILGESVIRQLSATDLWLLLESAYCHDLGMIVTAEKAKEAIDSGKILEHFKNIQNDTAHELYFCTKTLKIDNNKIVFIDNDFSLTKADTVKYLLADFFRKQHGVNASSYILSPHSTLSLSSPRAIIPNRLYELLGRICDVHTKDFSFVMNLPYVEDGIDIDSTHPRFVACMLRLGDLLDIDNGRFSETLLKTLGEIPDSTNAHKDKHMSIKHKSINTREIEIIAECHEKSVAHITQQWFNWIQEEFTAQTLSWNSIVPPTLKAFLPSVKKLIVNLAGYQYLNPKNKPIFTVDTPKALELLQGANFYESPFKAIRELLQNSIDATLIRVWEENRNNIHSIADFLKIVPQYTIDVIIEDNDDGYTNLVIKDKGTGISHKDLKYLSSTGSSSNNYERKNKIAEIPEWMQPVGFFGIGFQSSFLLTDLVEIITNSIYTNEAYLAELHSPQSKYKGDIYIKDIPNNIKLYSYGTTLSIKIDNKKVFASDSIKSNAHTFSDNYSFVYFGILEELKEISRFSFIPILINGEEIKREQFDFVSSNNIEIKLSQSDDQCSFYFKNIKTAGIYIKNFKGIINYHQGISDVLELSRKSVKSEFSNMILNECIIALEEYYYKLYNENKIPYNYAVCLYINTNDLLINSQLAETIRTNSKFPAKENNHDILITVKDLLQKNKIEIQQKGMFTKYSLIIDGDKAIMEIPTYLTYVPFDILMYELSSYPFIGITDFYENIDDTGKYYVIKTEYSKTNDINRSSIGLDKVKSAIDFFKGQKKYSFYFIPMIYNYEKLGIRYKDSNKYEFIINYPVSSISGVLFPIYKINNNQWKDGRNQKFYKWIKDNLIDTNLTLDEIICLYNSLISDCKSAGFDILD